MRLHLLRRRSPESRHPSKYAATCSAAGTQKLGGSLACPTSLCILILLCVYGSYNLLSDSFHVCAASRKLGVFCFPERSKPTFDLLQALNSRNYHNRSLTVDEDEEKKKKELEIAMKKVKEITGELRSSARRRSRKAGEVLGCEERGIYVYDLPSKFNKDLLAQCNEWIPWANLCDYFDNDGMGRRLPELGEAWYKTHQYALEPIFHKRALNHRCRVHNPGEAKLFYVPFYGGLDILRWHFKNVSEEVKDALSRDLLRWLDEQPGWRRSGGADHVVVLGKITWDFRRNGRSWGNTFLKMKEMKMAYKFLIEREPWELNEIGVPHPTYFHPRDDGDIEAWQGKIISTWRRNRVGFAGAARPDNVRSLLIEQCKSSERYCKFLDCGGGSCSEPQRLVNLFMESEFCLQPPGDSPTRKSVFDCLVTGCIPVIFSPFTAHYQYQWHLPEDHRKYSVFIDEAEVKEGRENVIERLMNITEEERHEMRRFIVYELMPGLVYGDSASEFRNFRDAFEIAIDNLIDRIGDSKHLE